MKTFVIFLAVLYVIEARSYPREYRFRNDKWENNDYYGTQNRYQTEKMEEITNLLREISSNLKQPSTPNIIYVPYPVMIPEYYPLPCNVAEVEKDIKQTIADDNTIPDETTPSTISEYDEPIQMSQYNVPNDTVESSSDINYIISRISSAENDNHNLPPINLETGTEEHVSVDWSKMDDIQNIVIDENLDTDEYHRMPWAAVDEQTVPNPVTELPRNYMNDYETKNPTNFYTELNYDDVNTEEPITDYPDELNKIHTVIDFKTKRCALAILTCCAEEEHRRNQCFKDMKYPIEDIDFACSNEGKKLAMQSLIIHKEDYLATLTAIMKWPKLSKI